MAYRLISGNLHSHMTSDFWRVKVAGFDESHDERK